MKLHVWENGTLIGILESTPNLGECFHYTEQAKRRISISLPLSDKTYIQKDCLPYFSGLLPDGDQRDRMARAIHTSTGSVMKLLAGYGRDIAGSLSILEEDEVPTQDWEYIPITESELCEKIRNVGTVSLFSHRDKDIRLSLAGAMDKIPLHTVDGKWYLPKGDAASSVILKPNDRYSSNEYVCTLLAKECGLSVPEVSFVHFETEPALLTVRFDRKTLPNGRIGRIHQEDFCQALGIRPENKYEEERGPGYKECLDLLWRESALPLLDTKAFLEGCVFNYLIGNCDAHGKNFSFLYDETSEKVRLSPFYDLVSSTIYPEFSRNMAMKAGKHKDIDKMTKEDLWAIDNGSRLMKTIVKDISAKLRKSLEVLPGKLDSSERSVLLAIAEDATKRIQRIS